MLRWVAVSLDRWELRDGDRKMGALISIPATGWAKQNGYSDAWIPLPRGKKYLSAQKNVRLAALDLEFNLGVNSSGVLDRHRRVA